MDGEEAIGHGILEFLDTLPDNLPAWFRPIWTSFAVRDSLALVPGSIVVQVDGRLVPGQVDPRGHVVQIHAQDVGGAGSTIDITACTR